MPPSSFFQRLLERNRAPVPPPPATPAKPAAPAAPQPQAPAPAAAQPAAAPAPVSAPKAVTPPPAQAAPAEARNDAAATAKSEELAHALEELRSIRAALEPEDSYLRVPCEAVLRKLPAELRGPAWTADKFPAGELKVPRKDLLAQLGSGRVTFPLAQFIVDLPAGWLADSATSDTKVDLDLSRVVPLIPRDWIRPKAKTSAVAAEVAQMADFFAAKRAPAAAAPAAPATPATPAAPAAPGATAPAPARPVAPAAAPAPVRAPVPAKLGREDDSGEMIISLEAEDAARGTPAPARPAPAALPTKPAAIPAAAAARPAPVPLAAPAPAAAPKPAAPAAPLPAPSVAAVPATPAPVKASVPAGTVRAEGAGEMFISLADEGKAAATPAARAPSLPSASQPVQRLSAPPAAPAPAAAPAPVPALPSAPPAVAPAPAPVVPPAASPAAGEELRETPDFAPRVIEESAAEEDALPAGVRSTWDGRDVQTDAGVHAIDVNRAALEDLLKLPGVGPHVAEAILSHRQAHGPFASVFDLAGVEGVGPKLFRKLTGLSLKTRQDRHEVLNGMLGLEGSARPTLSVIAQKFSARLDGAGVVLSTLDGMPLASSLEASDDAVRYAAIVPQMFRRTRRYFRQLLETEVHCMAIPTSQPMLLLVDANALFVVVALKPEQDFITIMNKTLDVAHELHWLLDCRAVVAQK